MCGHGFRSDGNAGCEPILPPNDCPDGSMALPGDTTCKAVGAIEPPKCAGATMAIPGESACRPIAACGAPPWGTIPVDATTQYVDASFSGGASDGTALKPWTTIAAAVTAAAPRAVVAIAAGRYAESVALVGKAVSLWGRCAEMVEVTTSGGSAAIAVGAAAAKSEVHGVGVTGDGIGIAIASGANDVVLDSVWVHGTSQIGVDALAPFAMRGSLVDGAHGRGVRVQYSAATIERSVVRNVDPEPSDLRLGQGIVSGDVGLRLVDSVVESCHGPAVLSGLADLTVIGSVVRDTQASVDTGNYGEGIEVDAGLTDLHAVTIQDSLVTRSRTYGIYIRNNAKVLIERTRVAGTLSRASTRDFGGGMEIRSEHDASSTVKATATIRDSLFEHNRTTGVSVSGAHLSLETSVVRDTLATESTGNEGSGVAVNTPMTIRADATIRRSLLERNRGATLLVQGADVVVEESLIRHTSPDDATKTSGYGVQAAPDVKGTQGSTLVMRASVVDDSFTGGIVVFSSKVTVDACVVHGTKARASDGHAGRGIVLQLDTIGTTRPSLTMTTTLVAEQLEAGITLDNADATIDASQVRDTHGETGTGLFGDGIALEGHSTLALTGSRVAHAARAGLAVFGSSASLATTSLSCNAIDLDGDADADGTAYTFDTRSDNACGCGATTHVCQVLSSNLAPPRALGK
jgi:hypothetical protein